MLNRIRIAVFVAGLVALSVGKLHAQYLPGTSQPFQFAQVINPAYAGVEASGVMNLSYRYQWSGLGSAAPTYSNLTYSFRLNQPLEASAQSLRTSKTKQEVPVGKRIFHGLALNAFRETFSYLKTTGFYAGYAVHVPLAEGKFLALGMGLSFEDRQINSDKFYLGVNPDQDNYFESFLAQGTKYAEINLRSGIAYHGKKSFIGITYLPAVRKAVRSFNDLPVETYNLLAFQGGTLFRLSPEVDLRPSIWGTLIKAGELQIRASAKLCYQDKLWMGIDISNSGFGVLGAGYALTRNLMLNYSYDFSFGNFRDFGSPSHEVILGVRFNRRSESILTVW